jgi:hypothetical protein
VLFSSKYKKKKAKIQNPAPLFLFSVESLFLHHAKNHHRPLVAGESLSPVETHHRPLVKNPDSKHLNSDLETKASNKHYTFKENK